jgi:hypothetical protein
LFLVPSLSLFLSSRAGRVCLRSSNAIRIKRRARHHRLRPPPVPPFSLSLSLSSIISDHQRPRARTSRIRRPVFFLFLSFLSKRIETFAFFVPFPPGIKRAVSANRACIRVVVLALRFAIRESDSSRTDTPNPAVCSRLLQKQPTPTGDTYIYFFFIYEG